MFLISSSPFISKSHNPLHIRYYNSLYHDKKIEMKVDIDCEKCKHAILEAVTELEGVNQVSLDQEKSILTVVGTTDPVCIAKQLKKIKQKPVVISVGPPKKPEPKKPECKPCYGPYSYYPDYVSVNTYEGGSGCTIM